MKKIYFIIGSILSISVGYGQILPIEEIKEIVIDSDKVLPPGTTYVKDINNKLDKFVGTWRGEVDNKSYEFVVEKITLEANDLGYKEDVLIMRYDIKNSSGTTVENTLGLPVDSPYVIEGYFLNDDSSYMLTYAGKEGKCGQGGNLFINIRDDDTMRLKLTIGHKLITPQDCPNGVAEQVLPTKEGGVILTRA